MILVDVDTVSVSRPDRPLLDRVSLTIASGDRVGVVGVNGTGKSTLLRVLAGTAAPESGVVRRGQGVRVSVLDQQVDLPPGTVREAVGDDWQAEAALDRLGLGDELERSTAELSGGQAKRVALARALVGQADHRADLLILDEPTNHLDIAGIAWLEGRLAAFTGGLVLVTHDRHVLDRVVNRVVELDAGTAYLHQGGYTGYLEGREQRLARDAKASDVRRNLARSELAWLRRGAPARTRKPKARIEAATALLAERDPVDARTSALDLHVAQTPRLGSTVIELEGVDARRGERLVVSGVELSLAPDERLGIVGPNGAGKSTLLDILAGRLSPGAGKVVTGPTVQVGLWDQLGRVLDPAARSVEVVAGPHRRPDWSDEAFLTRFWFDKDTAWAPVSTLSGGERRRLELVAVLAARPNVLLLDEPTNDLDLDTLRVLEDFLEGWPGALVVASHDRAFLERTVTDVAVLDGGRLTRPAGGLGRWLATVGAPAAPSPRRPPGGPSGGGRTTGAGATGAVAPPARSGRSASTVRHRLRELDKEMAALTRRRDKLTLELDAAVAGADHQSIAAAGAALAEAQAALAEAEERWLELAEEAEATS